MSSYGESELSINSRTVGKARVLAVTGSPFYPRLEFILGLTLQDITTDLHSAAPLTNYQLRDLSGDLRLEEHAPSIGTLQWIGQRAPVRSSSSSLYEQQIRVICELDQVRLERFEEHRAGRPPELWMELWPAFVTQTGSPLDVSLRGLFVKIPRDDWLNVLSTVGYGRYVVVEVRTDKRYEEQFQRAYAGLREARRMLSGGDNTGAIAACRTAFEAFFNALKANAEHNVEENGSYVKALLGPHTDEARAAEYARIAKGVRELTNFAHHATPAARSYGRAEAVFVIRATEDFLQLVADLTVRNQ